MHYAGIADQFKKSFSQARVPRLCRAPGRVNLIGEHTDYNGLPVLPAALTQEVVLAYAPNESQEIRLHNTDSRFSSAAFANEPEIARAGAGDWSNYARAAVQAVNTTWPVAKVSGLDILVASDLPHAAGLSSSSALVVAVALAYLDALGLKLDDDVSRAE